MLSVCKGPRFLLFMQDINLILRLRKFQLKFHKVGKKSFFVYIKLHVLEQILQQIFWPHYYHY